MALFVLFSLLSVFHSVFSAEEGHHMKGFKRMVEDPPPPVRVYPTGDTVANDFASNIRIFFDNSIFDRRNAVISIIDPDSFVHNCVPGTFVEETDQIIILTNLCRGGRDVMEGVYIVDFDLNLLGGGSAEFTNAINFIQIERAPWPFENDLSGWPPELPNLAGSLMENWQSFGDPYWHGGLDIITTHNANNREGDLYCPVDGVVVQIIQYGGGDAYWSIMVEDTKGFIWQFHHIDPPTHTVSIGDTVTSGQVLGKVIFWSAQWNGARYHHVHLNICRPDPRWPEITLPYIDGWQFFNPLQFLEINNFTNTTPFSKNGVMYFLENDSQVAFASSEDAETPVLRGQIDIIMSIMCDFIPTNNVPGHPWPNGIFQIGYYVTSAGSSSKSSSNLIEMHKMPDEWTQCLPNREENCRDTVLFWVLEESFSFNGTTHNTIWNYNIRDLYYRVTNVARGEPHATFGYFDTAEIDRVTGQPLYPNGEYEVTVFARDYYRNSVEFTNPVIIQN